MCDPVSITLGVVSAGLGIAQSVSSYNQAKQNVAYQNQVAEQNFQFQQRQASAARSFEQMRYDQQEALIAQTRLLADRAYEDEISQLNLRLMQEQEAAAQQKQKAGREGLAARGEVTAAGRVGNTVDNLIADYYRQQAQFDFATDRNLAFTTAQVQEQKRGSAATRGSRIASQQPYIQQPVLDPIAPIPQSNPSSTPYVLSGVSSVIGGVSTGMSTSASIKNAGYTWKGGKYTRS